MAGDKTGGLPRKPTVFVSRFDLPQHRIPPERLPPAETTLSIMRVRPAALRCVMPCHAGLCYAVVCCASCGATLASTFHHWLLAQLL